MEETEQPRVLCWFSAGAASAVATRLALETYGDRCVVVTIDPGSEHPDNDRFRADCERWFGVGMTTLKSDKYPDTWAVWEQTGYLVGPAGARCTGELKKRPRYAFERPDDVHVFGYTVEERDRADRFIAQNPGVDVVTPLIDRGLTKADCLALIDMAGIEIPAMYKLGFQNNNCIGCPKGGVGYWNHIRRHFPSVFDRMARLERRLGHTVLRETVGGQTVPLYLDELDPNRGNVLKDPSFDCSLVCYGLTLDGVTEARTSSVELRQRP